MLSQKEIVELAEHGFHQQVYPGVSHPLLKALRMINRLREFSFLKNFDAFDIMCLYFLKGVPREKIAEEYKEKLGKDRTTLHKLTNQEMGKESARRHDVKRIFFEYVKEEGLDLCPPSDQSKSISTRRRSKGT